MRPRGRDTRRTFTAHHSIEQVFHVLVVQVSVVIA
jgi:hypothetical protein